MSVRAGVIGFGLAGRVFHAPFLRAARGVELAAIVQRSGDEAAAAHPGATIVRSAAELVQSDVDLVVVATPNETHVPLAKLALAAGKHVVIDKPFAPSVAEAEELTALAQQQGVLLAPFHNRRFDGDFLTLQRLLREEAVGRPVSLQSRFDRFRPLQRPNTWKEAAGDQNGLLMDLGPHVVDQALLLFGRPDWLQASVRTDRDSSDIVDAFDITLQFSHNGHPLRVELGGTMLAAEPQPRYLLHGTRGSYRKLGVDPQEPAILAGAAVPPQDSAADWLTEDASAFGTLTTAFDPSQPAALDRRAIPTMRGDYRVFYEQIAAATATGAPPPTTPRDAVRVARILEWARHSSRTGERIAITATDW